MTNDKPTIRLKSLSTRNNLPVLIRTSKSLEICKKIEILPGFQESKHTLLYYPHGSEVDVLPLINKYMGERTIYLPRMLEDSQFIALPVNDLNTLIRGHYGIPEPSLRPNQEAYEGKIDCVVVPGVVFDSQGNRLGMGKGFYDRYLARVKPKCTIGAAFEEQILAEVPCESYDKSVDTVVTEVNTY